MQLLNGVARNTRFSALSLVSSLIVIACTEPTGPPLIVPAASASVLPASRTAASGVVDFSSWGNSRFFEHNFFVHSDGLLFPRERCGPAGCRPWFVGYIQGDDALVGQEPFGAVRATFSTPISSLTLRVSPAEQGTAKYMLTVYSASNVVVGRTALTVTQDIGDPTSSPLGYFTIAVSNLPPTATSFRLTNKFVRSSFPFVTVIEYGVASISYQSW